MAARKASVMTDKTGAKEASESAASQPAAQLARMLKTPKNNAKACVLKVLSNGKRLSLSEIKAVIDGTGNSGSFTYQGVRKAVLALAAEGAVEKVGSLYLLSGGWAKAVRETVLSFEDSALLGGIDFPEMPPLYSKTVVFSGPLCEAYYFALRQLIKARDSLNQDNPLVTCIQPHALPLTMVKRDEYAMAIKLKGRHYIACTGNTPLDRANLEVWQKVGATTAFGCDVPKNADLAVVGEFVIEIFPSPKILREVDVVFQKAKGLDNAAVSALQKVWFEKKGEIKVRISRDGKRGNRLTEEILSFFR
jgi:hypothetical protein